MSYMPSTRNRDGVALILVVGMLALLMIMGVAFAVFMRTERIAAGNFRNDVQARQLLHVALARAIEDVEFRASVSNAHYPEWFVLTSTSTNQMVSNADWATNYIPWGALNAASLTNVQWIDLGSQAQGWQGRIAYACINASGLLDVNYAGGGGARGSGTNASEIQIRSLPDVGNTTALLSQRPYDTLQEANLLGAAGLNGAASSFVTYSANPKTYPNGATEPWVDISGDDAALQAKHAAIAAAFMASVSNAAPADAEFMYANLLDYVDKDHIPRDLASPCTESVPMLNEVSIKYTVNFRSDGTFLLGPDFYVEAFYPFVKPCDGPYTATCDASFQATDPLFVPPDIVARTTDATFSPSDPIDHPKLLTRIRGGSKAGVYTNSFGGKVVFTASVRMTIRQGSNASGTIVDASPYPLTASPLVIGSTTCNIPIAVTQTSIVCVAGAETVDPRYNWDCASRNQWRPYGRGLYGTADGSMNTNTITEMNKRFTDGHTAMFVADRPLRTPAELSYLLRSCSAGPDGWWRTIRLMDEYNSNTYMPADKILDYFVVNSSNDVRYGCVNPNTRSTTVLKAVLFDMPLDKYPGEPNPSTVVDDSSGWASNLASWWTSSANPACGSISNLSQLGSMTNVFLNAIFSGKTPFEREAFFRNLAGLFGVRQNYFVVLLYAQGIKTTPDGKQNVIAESRAVAEVWRDARGNSNGKHPCKIRQFKLLPNP